MAVERRHGQAHAEEKRRAAEQQQLVRQLRTQLSLPPPELAALKDEMDVAQQQHQTERLALEFETKRLREQLASATGHALQLQQQADERLLQLRAAQREVKDLGSQLGLLVGGAGLLGGGAGARKMQTNDSR